MSDKLSIVSGEQAQPLMKAFDYSHKAAELYAIPEVATSIKRLSDSGKASIKQIANMVMLDPGLSAQILKLANSSIYRFARKIETVDKAIQVIGVRSVYDYALVFSVANILGDDQSHLIDVKRFWRQSLRCALLGKHIAALCGERDTHRVLTSGLLHNVGELAVLRVTPNLLNQCNSIDVDNKPKHCQQSTLGLTFADISASLLQRWMLPESIVSTIATQHHTGAPSSSMETKIIQLAYELSIVLTHPENYQFDVHVPSFLYQCLDISAEQIVELFAEVEKESEETLQLFIPSYNRAA